jgi:DNA-binding response OmpR family regulator
MGEPLILLVEDDAEMHRMLATVLQGLGARVASAWSGADAASVLARSRDGERFALVLTDLRLPGRSGFDLVSDLRAWDRDVPVVLITAFGDDDTHLRARRLGARILDKPFAIDELRGLVRALLPQLAA